VLRDDGAGSGREHSPVSGAVAWGRGPASETGYWDLHASTKSLWHLAEAWCNIERKSLFRQDVGIQSSSIISFPILLDTFIYARGGMTERHEWDRKSDLFRKRRLKRLLTL